jgi:hypothetical protein
MSDLNFLRCNCESCGSPIEFPTQGVGLKIDCPHCGHETLLSASAAALAIDLPRPSEAAIETSSASSESALASPTVHKKRSPLLVGALVLLVLAAVGGVWYFLAGPGAKKPEPAVAQNPEPPVAKPAATNPAPNLTAVRPGPSNVLTAPEPSSATEPKSPKSIDDLKPSAVTLEKAKAGSLVHAVGTIKNTSDQQRFGVRVELELTDANGKPAGKASDYTQVIEPRQEWRFRALVLDPKGIRAVAGKVSSIKEDN